MENAKIFRTSFGEMYGATDSHLFLDRQIIGLSYIRSIIVVHNKEYVLIVACLHDGERLSEKICFSDSVELYNHDRNLEEFATFLEKECSKEVIFWNDFTVQP